MRVDFSSDCGEFKKIHGANIGPYCLNGQVDLSEWHTRIGFPTIRLHDCAFYCWDVVDIPAIFPLWHLDANDPQSYSFAKTDGYIQSILNCGSEIVYRLGVTIQNHPTYRFDTNPPEDYDKWADICIQIIRHYNEGWADGFHHNIRYWEIWNEPEIGTAAMWNAPYEEYVRFYIHVAKRIKAACPDILIGGPAFAGQMLTNRSLMHTFLPAVREANAPLDFCSWHAYPQTPGQLSLAATDVRSILDSYGYTQTESHLNEWNLAPYGGNWGMFKNNAVHMHEYIEQKKSAECAALVAGCLIDLQDAPINMTNFYEAGNGTWGMFELSGVPGKPVYSFLAYREMLDHAPVRVTVERSDPDTGLALAAGRTEDFSELRLLAANYHTAQPEFSIDLDGLPKDITWQVEDRCIDSKSNLDTMRSFTLEAGTTSLTIPASPHSVHLLTFRRA